jgi:hypothetical protein
VFILNHKIPVFIVGCQRSGTTICQNIFLESRQVQVFKESNKQAMTDDYRLRPDEEIRSLITQSRHRVLLFKPLNDSQLADRVLERFEHARLIWIYRGFADTVNSAVAKWSSTQKDMMQSIGDALLETGSLQGALDRFDRLDDKPNCGIYAERMAVETVAKLIEWTRVAMTDHTGAAILWYIRNRIFFDLRLDRDPRAMLVRYEDLVRSPEAQIERMCRFMEMKYSSRLTKKVLGSSINEASVPDLPATVLYACEGLTRQLDDVIAAGSS